MQLEQIIVCSPQGVFKKPFFPAFHFYSIPNVAFQADVVGACPSGVLRLFP